MRLGKLKCCTMIKKLQKKVCLKLNKYECIFVDTADHHKHTLMAVICVCVCVYTEVN